MGCATRTDRPIPSSPYSRTTQFAACSTALDPSGAYCDVGCAAGDGVAGGAHRVAQPLSVNQLGAIAQREGGL